MKKIMKRNLSVLLTVLMLLSCWVFVAPEKAAAVVDQEIYDIDVAVDVQDENDRDDNFYTITYMRPNGSTGSVKKYRAAEMTSGATGESDYRIDSFALEGIPISLHYSCNGYEDSKWYIKSVSLTSGDTKTLFKGTFGCKTTFYSQKTQGDINFTNLTCSLEDHGYDREYTYDTAGCTATGRPHVQQITMERRADEDGDVQIPNEAGEYGSTGVTFYVKDQFGVRLGSKYYNVALTPDDSAQSAFITARSDDAYATNELEGYIINVAEGARRLQTVYNKNTHQWGGGGGERFDEPMTLTITDKKDTSIRRSETLTLPLAQPEYEVFFSAYSGGDEVVDPESYPKMIYSMPIGGLPGADRPGYSLLGFFTVGGETQNANNISGFGTRITENTPVTGSNENTPYKPGWVNAPCIVTIQNNKRQTIATYTGQYGFTLPNSINTGYNYSQLMAAAAYVKDPGETGEYNNLQPVGFSITDGYEYISSSEQVRSEDQIGQDFRDVPLLGDITVSVRYKQTDASRYTINFYDNSSTPLDQGTSSRTDYTFGQTPTLPTGERNSYVEDNTYTYSFAGWAKQRHAEDDHYFVDAKIVTTKNAQGELEEHLELSQAIPLVDIENMSVNSDVNYVAVYSRLFKDYSATFHYMRDGDEALSYTQADAYHYGGHITPPTSVERQTENGKVTDNPTASYIARGYIWDFDGWYTAEEGGDRVNFGDLTDTNASLNNVNGNEYWAHYVQGEPTNNLIRFFNKAGTLLESREVPYSETNNTTVPAMADSAYEKLAQRNLINYETDTTRYTFDKWVNVQNGEELPYSEFPLTPADYYPSYIEEPLHTLYLYNGKDLLFSYVDVAGAALNTENLGERITHPTRAGDMYSDTYIFKGYSTVEDFRWVSGETLVDLDTFVYPDEDVSLYAHYDSVPIDYSVKFLEDDQETVIEAQTLHYGDEIVVPTLTEAQTTKESDYTYNYTFMGWNIEPAKTCTGNAEYFTTFRQGYQYYTVKWLDYDGTLYKTDNYVYNAHIHQPYNTPEPPAYVNPETGEPDTSKANLFTYWEYVGTDGESMDAENPLEFAVGQKLGGATQTEIEGGTYTGPLTPAYWTANNNVITLRARYAADTNYITVSKYDGIADDSNPFGQVFDTQKILYGTTFGEYKTQLEPSPYVPQYTDDVHYSFANWNRIQGDLQIGLADNYEFTADTAIVETFASEAHGGVDGSKWSIEVSKEPTFTEEGAFIKSCTAENCGYVKPADSIPVLKDTTAPTGKLYVKDYNWSTYLETLSDSPLKAAPSSIIIMNAEDTADSAADVAANTPYNRNGDGSGIASIAFALVPAAEAGNPSAIETWYTGYTYSPDTAPNASLTVRNLLSLKQEGSDEPLFPQIENDESFVIYAKLTDNATAANGAAQPNVTYLRSDTLVLDTTSPTIVLTSTDDVDGIPRTSIRHCVDVTVTIEDDDLASVVINGNDTMEIDGETREIKDLVGEGLTITKRGQYQVVATDMAGNSSKTNFEIIGAHKLVTYIVEATCTNTGLNAKRCQLCGAIPESEQQVIDALGHNWVHKVNAATCTKAGKEYDHCDRCGEIKEGTMVELPATGHDWQSQEEAYVLRAATCNTAGILRYTCKLCGKTKNEAYAALDPDGSLYTAALEAGTAESASVYGHSLYGSQTLPATCTADGDVTRECKYCGKYFVMEVLHALGHTPSTKDFFTIQEATCTETGLRAPYCANECGTVMYDTEEGGLFGNTYVETVPALGHDFKFVETVPPTETEEGYDLWECTRCDAVDHRNVVSPMQYCDVKVYNIKLNENGETVTDGDPVYEESLPAGTTLLYSTLGEDPAMEANDTFRYIFRGWGTTKEDLKGLQDAAIAADAQMPKDGEEGTAENEEESGVTLPEVALSKKVVSMTIEADTTLYAVYSPKFVNYTVALYKENGDFIRNIGYLHYGNLITPTAPAKPDDAYGSYAFIGWKLMNPAAGDDATPFESIQITKNASYQATYVQSGEVKSYVVFWMYGTTKLGEAKVSAGGTATYTGETPDPIALGLKPTPEEHYYFTGWSAETTNVLENTRVYAQFDKAFHTFETETTTQTCTTGDGYKRVCSVCGFFEEHYTTDPLGHSWQANGATVLPIVHQDGTYEVGHRPEKCSRCGETRDHELDPVEVTVTVKNSDGEPINGAKVTAYANASSSSKIMSAFSGSDGVAKLLVPEAGKYRIVVEYDGRQGTSEIDVDGNGKITGGSVPVINSGSGATAAPCPKNCTCHKSGLWPTIYRAVYKFIYLLTRTRCCPDANY